VSFFFSFLFNKRLIKQASRPTAPRFPPAPRHQVPRMKIAVPHLGNSPLTFEKMKPGRLFRAQETFLIPP
jgi:hypothetical protein